MKSRINLCPDAGEYQTPLMHTVTVASAPQVENLLILEFRATLESDLNKKLSIAVPISKIEAAGLLRSLKILQERGLIPFVPEANPTKN
jgi:hypothetical protein